MVIQWLKSFKRRYEEQRLFKALKECTLALKEILKEDDLPVLVVCYNNGAYIENTVLQLQNIGIKPIILDNCSDDCDTKKTLELMRISGSAHVIGMDKNYGHLVGFLSPIYELLPEVFAYTDPDLQFSSTLPCDFLDVLSELTVKYSTFKAGFALSLTADEILCNSTFSMLCSKPIAFQKSFTVNEWESPFWKMRLADDSLEVYGAKIDTTFAVYRKGNFTGDFYDAVRVAGDYTAVHLPWFPSLGLISTVQKSNYLKASKSSAWR